MNSIQVLTLELAGKGYSCAQILLIGGLRLLGRDNPDLVRAMGGLAQGVGCSGDICGALSGGVCLLALHTARGTDRETPLDRGPVLMQLLTEWFRQELCRGGEVSCDALLGAGGGRGPDGMRPDLCGSLIEQVWNKSLELLLEAGIDPQEGRPES